MRRSRLTVQEHFNDLVVGTYGRGFWILDDISPIQGFTEQILQSDVHLFAPRPAYRFRFRESPVTQPEDPGAGKNPTYGASIHYYYYYYLKAVPKEELKIQILDSKGRLVRTLTESGDEEDGEEREGQEKKDKGLPKKEGINRAYWDLLYEKTDIVKLRTKPLEHSHVPIPDRGWRSLVEAERLAPLAAPGTYTVKLILDEKELTETIAIKKDPHSAGTDEDVGGQVETSARDPRPCERGGGSDQ